MAKVFPHSISINTGVPSHGITQTFLDFCQQDANIHMHKADPLIMTVDKVFSAQECQQLIDFSHQFNYEVAPITVSRTASEVQLEYRNNQRIIYDDAIFAEKIFAKIKAYLPEFLFKWQIRGLNERFRFYLYENGQTFKPHYDGNYEVSYWHSSQLTLLIYLNEDFDGGETIFYSESRPCSIKPKMGQILIFEHRQLHEGAPVLAGKKYVLRTDVMYVHPVFHQD